jgi:hypothetical protein
MPRYRFDWQHVPADTIAEIGVALGLEDDVPGQLRQRYGARPTTRFVQDLWPVLREGWLARDDELRDWVIAELRSARLGATEHTNDAAYLRSCRNAETLRRLVLAAFHVAGDPAFYQAGDGERPTPAAAVEPEARRHSGDDEFDLDAIVAAAWAAFAARLDDALETLDDVLVVHLPCSYRKDELEGAAPYVQFLSYGGGALIRGEVSGNEYLDERLQLTAAQQRQLTGLGWASPDGTPDGSHNFYLDETVECSADVATLATRTMREVFDVPHPSFLDWDGATPAPGEPDEDDSGLRAQVDRTLAEAFQEPLIHDDDGDIPIRSGSAMVFVRVSDHDPVVELFSPLLTGAAGDALALERLNAANRTLRFGRLVWVNGVVLAHYELWCDPFVPETLLRSVEIMTNLADDVDDRLRVQLGGRRFFEDSPVETPATDDPLSLREGALLTILQLTAGGTSLTAEQAAQICGHDRDLVLALITESSQDAIEWRDHAELTEDEEEAAVCRIEEHAAQANVDLLREALRVIVLGA